MFHQVLIRPEDRIVSVFYGGNVTEISALLHPRSSKSIVKYHYIDNFVDIFETEEEAVEISDQVSKIHKNVGFELRGFTSSRIKFIHDGLQKVLGVYWNSSSDTFKFHLKFNNENTSVISGEKSY